MIVLVSHSDGINPFLKLFAPDQQKLSKPCYCATIAVELSAKDANAFNVENVNIIQA